jgi:hypothetical protein
MAEVILSVIWWLRSITSGEWILFGCCLALGWAFKKLIEDPIMEWIHRNTFL